MKASEIAAAAHSYEADIVAFLRDLVAIPAKAPTRAPSSNAFARRCRRPPSMKSASTVWAISWAASGPGKPSS